MKKLTKIQTLETSLERTLQTCPSLSYSQEGGEAGFTIRYSESHPLSFQRGRILGFVVATHMLCRKRKTTRLAFFVFYGDKAIRVTRQIFFITLANEIESAVYHTNRAEEKAEEKAVNLACDTLLGEKLPNSILAISPEGDTLVRIPAHVKVTRTSCRSLVQAISSGASLSVPSEEGTGKATREPIQKLATALADRILRGETTAQQQARLRAEEAPIALPSPSPSLKPFTVIFSARYGTIEALVHADSPASAEEEARNNLREYYADYANDGEASAELTDYLSSPVTVSLA